MSTQIGTGIGGADRVPRTEDGTYSKVLYVKFAKVWDLPGVFLSRVI